MKKKFLFVSAVALGFTLVGCSNISNASTTTTTTATAETSTTTVEENINITVNVTDIDGEIKAYEIEGKKGTSLVDLIKTKTTLVSETTQYGTSVSSIGGSVIDANYYLSIYENNEYAQTGIDGLVADDGDVFDFKVECWNTISSGYGTFDETDILVDKALYHYAKTYMQDGIKKYDDYTDGLWTNILINLMNENSYDSTLFNLNNASDEYKAAIEKQDLSEVANDANLGKYYFALKALKSDTTAFKTAKSDFYSSIDTTYSDYVTPFVLAPALGLEIKNDNLNTLVTNAATASTTWGTDALNWQIVSLQAYDNTKFTKDVLSQLNIRAVDAEYTAGGTTTALCLMSFAALNVNPRSAEYEIDGKDMVEYLMENYYDEDLELIKCYKSDLTTNYSTDQIYASLAAYKIQRDNNKATFVFYK